MIHSRGVRFDEQLRGTEEENPSTDDNPSPVMLEKEHSESDYEELPTQGVI